MNASKATIDDWLRKVTQVTIPGVIIACAVTGVMLGALLWIVYAG